MPFLAVGIMAFSGCNTNDPENGSSSSSSGTGTTIDNKSDFVEQHVWNDTVTIVWNGASAEVTNMVDSVTITNTGGYVSVSSLKSHVAYVVRGEGVGQLRFDSVNPKFQLIVEDLSLTCNDGPAINNQCHKSFYLVLKGTSSLADKSGYNTTSSANEDLKAALFSEGQVIVSGDGTMTVTGNNKHAFASDDYVRVRSGKLNIVANANDGLHTNDGVLIEDGTMNIKAVDEGVNVDEGQFYMSGGSLTVTTSGTSAKGIKSQDTLTIAGGTIEVTTPGKESEGIESKSVLIISDGKVTVTAYDDAINSGSHMYIKGGEVTAVSTNNDGLDANGNLYIQEGIIIACGAGSPECGIDANEEGGYSVYFTGGSLVSIGGGNSVPTSSESTQAYVSASVSVSAGQRISVADDVATLISIVVPDSYNPSQGGNPGGGGRWQGPGGGGPGGGGSTGGGLLISYSAFVSGKSYIITYGSSTVEATAQTTGSSSQGGRPGW